MRNLRKKWINQSTTIESEIFDAVALEEAWSFVDDRRTLEIELMRATWAPANLRVTNFKLTSNQLPLKLNEN